MQDEGVADAEERDEGAVDSRALKSIENRVGQLLNTVSFNTLSSNRRGSAGLLYGPLGRFF